MTGAGSIGQCPDEEEMLVKELQHREPEQASYQMCESESPSRRDLISRSLALSPESVASSPTADLNRVSNLAWSWAVMKERRTLGILLAFLGWVSWVALVPPVWNDAAIWLKPVGWGFMA